MKPVNLFAYLVFLVCFLGSFFFFRNENKLEESPPSLDSVSKEGFCRFILAVRRESMLDQEWSLKLPSKHIKSIRSLFVFPSENKDGSYLELFTLQFLEGVSFSSDLERIALMKEVLFVEPDQVNRISIRRPRSGSSKSFLGSLNLYRKGQYSWWQEMIHFHDSVAFLKNNSKPLLLEKKSKEILVAVLDGGVDYEHPALKDNLWINPVIGKTRCGNDKHGCDTTKANAIQLGVPDIHPFGTTGPDRACSKLGRIPEGDCAHGTHVAGVIVAKSSENGAIGVCPMCKIMILRLMELVEGEGVISDSSILNALKYIALVNQMTDNPVRVINASFGKFQRSRAVSLLINYLRKTYKTIVVAAAGNEDTFKRSYPSGQRNVLSIGALDARAHKTFYSNQGPWVNLYAPGGGYLKGVSSYQSRIYSTYPGDNYMLSQGTSAAAPIVSGVAGFILSLDPSLSAEELEKVLLRGSLLDKKVRLLHMKKSLNYLFAAKHKNDVDEPRLKAYCGGMALDPAQSSVKSFVRSLVLCLFFLAPFLFFIFYDRRRRLFLDI